MRLTDEQVRDLTAKVAAQFPGFGGTTRHIGSNNPIAHALAGQPLQFAAGVSVEAVVRLVLAHAPASTPQQVLESLRVQALDDPLSDAALATLNYREVQKFPGYILLHDGLDLADDQVALATRMLRPSLQDVLEEVYEIGQKSGARGVKRSVQEALDHL